MKSILILVLTALTHPSVTFAQQDARPIGFNYEMENGDFAKVIGTVLRRISELNLDTQPGFQGFTMKGALVFGNEFEGININDLNGLDRRSGFILFPYDYAKSFNSGHQQRASVSLVGFRNMNEYSAVEGTFAAPDSFFGVVNTLDVGTITYDENYSYQQLKTLDIKFVTIEPRIGVLYSKEKNYYLALKSSIDIGIGTTRFVQPDGSEYFTSRINDYSVYNGKYSQNDPNMTPKNQMNFRWNYAAGIEFGRHMKKDGRVNFQAQWKGGIHSGRFSDSKIIAKNLAGNFDGFSSPRQELVKAPRVYNAVNTSLRYDRVINRKRLNANTNVAPDVDTNTRKPLRLGFEIEWNLLINDEFRSPPDGTKYDFNFIDNFNRKWVGKLVFKF